MWLGLEVVWGQTPALINLGFWLSLFSKKGGEVGTRGDQSLWKAKILQSKVNLYLDVFLQNKDNVDGVSTENLWGPSCRCTLGPDQGGKASPQGELTQFSLDT